ncbi:hypothetical protein SHIRM173S_08013 [Streptomyces hirsutus]
MPAPRMPRTVSATAPAPPTVRAMTMPGSAPAATTATVMRISRKIRPNSLRTWGRASRQASAAVTDVPSTARLVTVVSRAVAATVPIRPTR